MNAAKLEQARAAFVGSLPNPQVVAAPGVTFYKYERVGKLLAVCFIGKAGKPAWHYSFRTEAQRQAHIDQQIARVAAVDARKAEQKASKAAFVHSLEVGDILRSSWGYDQTNIDFYAVTKVIGKCVEIRELGQSRQQTGWETGDCVPVPGNYVGEPMKKLVGEGNAVRIESYASASLYHKGSSAAAFEPARWSSYA